MNVSVGIVGLPNVGKSTLFNALLKKQQALAANYPFATIEPNIGIVAVPDERLNELQRIVRETEMKSSEASGVGRPPLKPATVEFVDIAGLVKGASEGAGLGNKFLSHIREVKIIAHVVRAFEDENVIKEGSIDPLSDYQTIQTELMLADAQTLSNVNRKAKNEKHEKIQKLLEQGIPVRAMDLTDEEHEAIKDLFLLSSKPEIVVLNVAEGDYNPQKIEEITKNYRELLQSVIPDSHQGSMDSRFPTRGGLTRGNDKKLENNSDNIVVISAQIESDLAALSEDEQKEYLKGLGLEQSGLERLIQKAYQELGLISFLTCGEKEVRAWTITKDTNAQNAAGEIHTDFIKKFIKAEVVSYNDFIENSGWKGSREHGKARLEGKEYIVQDGDVIEFKIGT